MLCILTKRNDYVTENSAVVHRLTPVKPKPECGFCKFMKAGPCGLQFEVCVCRVLEGAEKLITGPSCNNVVPWLIESEKPICDHSSGPLHC